MSVSVCDSTPYYLFAVEWTLEYTLQKQIVVNAIVRFL